MGPPPTADPLLAAAEIAGEGYDVVIESAGVPASIDQAVALSGRHGEAVFIGIPHDPVVLPKSTFSSFLRREVTLHGAWNSLSECGESTGDVGGEQLPQDDGHQDDQADGQQSRDAEDGTSGEEIAEGE